MKPASILSVVLMAIFCLRRPRDWFVKIGLHLLVINTLVFVIDHYIFQRHIDRSLIAVFGITTLVALPFVLLTCLTVTWLFRVQQQLEHIALTDVLTGLPNRRAFLDRTKSAFVAGSAGYLLIVDADHFKRINDTYGHATGDDCLRVIADRLRHTLPKGAPIGRLGGEEFGVFLPGADLPDLVKVGKFLARTLHVPLEDGSETIRLTLSVGATDTEPLETLDAALDRADAALYEAKAQGRGRMILGPRLQDAKVA